MVVLLLPKALALLELVFDPRAAAPSADCSSATAGAVGETIFSTLHAPLLMLWHTRFVVTILLGKGVGWGTQKRAADGTTWAFAFRRHWGHTVIGALWGVLVWQLDAATFWWFTPVLAGMILSIPVSVLTSRRDLGVKARQMGLFLTPEEISPPRELAGLRLRLAAQEKGARPRRRLRTMAFRKWCWTRTSTPSMCRCCAKRNLIPRTPRP